MKINKILIGIIFILILSNIFFAYRSFELNKQLEQSIQVTDSTVWNEFTDLIGSLHYVSQELAQYDTSMSEGEKELYLYSLGKEEYHLNEIGHNLTRILIWRGQDEYLKYEEHIWIIEEFIGDVSRGDVKDERRIHNVAKVINEQQQLLSEMFYSDKAIAISGANEDENIKRIKEHLEIIIGEINKN